MSDETTGDPLQEVRQALSARLKALRLELFGEHGGPEMARRLRLAARTWNDCEPGIEHPAMFPLALAEQLIKTFSQEGDLVLDPFCGSGQTLLAARGCGRRFLGIEREERYVKIARDRLVR